MQPRAYLRANLRALKRWPGRYARTLALALRLKDHSPWQVLKNLAHLVGAAALAEHLLARQVPHVHVHFAYGAAEVALFLEALCGLPYSLSIHGSDVLLENPLIEEKLRRARFIVSNCHFHVENLRRRFPSLAQQRFYVVPGGLDLQAPPWSKPEPPLRICPCVFCTSARLVPVKAQEVLILALARLRDQGGTSAAG